MIFLVKHADRTSHDQSQMRAAIKSVFRAYRISTKDGLVIEGFKQNESNGAITLLQMGGAPHVVPIANIQTAGYIDGKSVTPNITAGMTPEQIAGILCTYGR